MISFFICLFLLVGGFFVYGKFAEKVFGPDDRRTPAIAMEDGADYVPMGTARIFCRAVFLSGAIPMTTAASVLISSRS